jgi:predicted dehydrogenase
VNLATIAKRKHIISDKPLALDAAEARTMWHAAQKAGVVHAVTFNYRGNPLVQQAREMIAKGELGRLVFVHGAYLQDWLFDESVYSWRLEPEKGGATSALGDIGSHWCDLAQHVSGSRIASVLADLTTVTKTRRRPAKSAEAFAGASAGPTEEFQNPTEDLASVLVRFENGAKGAFSVGQVCAGHKNDLWLEINGRKESLRWYQEQQNELWIGHAKQGNTVLPKDPPLLSEANRKYARLPGGHQEGWADAFRNIMSDIYGLVLAGKGMTGVPPAVATFEDGYRANCIVDSLLESNAEGGVWKKVRY